MNKPPVLAPTYATMAVSIGIAVLNDVHAGSALLEPLPSWAQALCIAVAPPILTYLSSWQTSHMPNEEE